MKIVVTIIGKDRVGIVAKVSTALAEHNVNVEDIRQNIIGCYNSRCKSRYVNEFRRFKNMGQNDT